MNTTDTTFACPECASSLTVPHDCLTGEILSCDECAADLEVVHLDPITLMLAPEVGEDWGE
ncbi:MAG: lysine biosynthesis protein LysW [Planctomycetes bacterium]|nr:lysine biosynthesis protein LysW [Planctomycetota bacterium]